MRREELVEFAKDMKAWRNRQVPQVTQQDLAALLGTTRATIANIESGRHSTREAWLDKLSKLIYAGAGEGRSAMDKSARAHYTATLPCPHCQCVSPGPVDGATYCIHCGEQLGRSCKACGMVSALLAKFCQECGTPLTATVARYVTKRDAQKASQDGAEGDNAGAPV
ncbi:MAG: helix-turn-helix domain-containing protein [Candidatus Hydrogenedentes bacterium]|nr:helix-turn-helix domain-containing protein [Candidatus Hydrogenedentota bacterium]